MAMYENSTAKPVLSLVKGNLERAEKGETSQVNPNSDSFSPRPLPPQRSDVINEDVSPQRWMQEYHKSRQMSECLDSKEQPVFSNGYTVISPRFLDQATPMNSTAAKFNALKINPEVNQVHKHSQKEPGMSLKRNKSDLLEGYKVYRGPASVTLGITRKQTEIVSSSVVESPECASYHQDIKGGVANDHLRRPNLPTFYYPDPLLISKHVGKDGTNQKINSAHFHASKSHSLPFRGHFPTRSRPQSATLSSQSQRPDERVKGSKSKHHLRKGRPALQVSTRASSLKQEQSSKLTDTHCIQPRGSFPSSPRQLGTIPRPSYKLDVNGGPKLENHVSLTPKSILKNNSYADTNSYLAIHSLRPSQELTRDISGQISPYLLPSDLSLNDFLLSPRESNRTSPAVSSRSSPSPSHAISSANRTVMGPKRPMSAVTNPSKYELNETHPSRRKSVTFNSYVSLMTGNRVSTIRSLSVDA